MKNIGVSFLVGILFVIGLGISGMTQPKKVVGFLDFFGVWDPSLLFVMIGAVSVHFLFYRIIRKRHRPLFSSCWHVPGSGKISPALVIGAIVFGMGWGLGGYCPGPALASLVTLDTRPVIFFVSMLAGMLFFKITRKLFEMWS